MQHVAGDNLPYSSVNIDAPFADKKKLCCRMIIQSKLDFTYFSVSGGKYVKSGHT